MRDFDFPMLQDPNGVYKSKNHGQTWTFYPFNLPALPYNQDKGLITWDLAEDPIHGFLYAATEPASKPPCMPTCYWAPWPRSKNGGQTWQNTSPSGWHATSIQVHPLTGDVYYQIEGGGVYVSHDFGDSRAPIGQNQGWELLIDPHDPSRFFGGAANSTGVRRSMNTGVSFQPIGPPNLSGPGIFHVALNGSSTKLYASSGGSP